MSSNNFINFNKWLSTSKNQEKWIESYIKKTFKLLSNGEIGSINVNIATIEDYELKIIPSQTNQPKKITARNLAKSIYKLYPRWDKHLIAKKCEQEIKKHQINTETLEQEMFRARKLREKNLKFFVSQEKEYNVKNTWEEFRIVRKGPDEKSITSLLASPEKAMENGLLIADGLATTICKATAENGKEVIIKRYNSKGLFYSITRSLIESRAMVCWKGAELFKWIGISTPQTLGILEVKSGPWIKKSYLITEYINGETLAQFFEEGHDQTYWNNVADKVSEILMTMPKVLVAHGDFKSTNMLIEKNAPVMIDLDSLRVYKSKSLFRRTYKKDIARFERNWIDHPSASKIFKPVIRKVQKILQ